MIDAVRHHPRNYAILLFLADTGCRVGGLISLTLDRLDLEGGTAILLEKGGRWHRVYFGEATAEALRAWLKVHPKTDHAYIWTTGSQGKPLDRSGVSQLISGLAKKIGASKMWGPHSIRHAVGEAYADTGALPTVTQHKLGHSSQITTLKYYYPHDEDRVKSMSQQHPLAPLRKVEPSSDSSKVIDLQHYRKITPQR